jgi:hypothetical protein
MCGRDASQIGKTLKSAPVSILQGEARPPGAAIVNAKRYAAGGQRYQGDATGSGRRNEHRIGLRELGFVTGETIAQTDVV